jgi:hypothetical protein
MKRKHNYYWCLSEKTCIIAEIGGFTSVRHWRNREQTSVFSNNLWKEWSEKSYNSDKIYRITREQFRRFKKTGKFPEKLGLKA